MLYRCQFPGCGFSTEVRTQIHRHHIVPREHNGSNQEHNRISLCPGHHTKIYIPNATRGIHANKGTDSIVLLGWKDSTAGKVLNYLENGEEKFV